MQPGWGLGGQGSCPLNHDHGTGEAGPQTQSREGVGLASGPSSALTRLLARAFLFMPQFPDWGRNLLLGKLHRRVQGVEHSRWWYRQGCPQGSARPG